MTEARLRTRGGKYLRVNLDTGHLDEEQLPAQTHRLYLGGTCLGARVLYYDVGPGVEWSAPANRLIVASGPLGGTRINGSGTVSVVTKGPLTNGAAASQANGFLGAYMRLNGFDGLMVEGAASSWVYLYVHDRKAELRDARHLVGKDTWELIDRLATEVGAEAKQLSVFGIGPAGENLVRFAAIVGDRGHVAGHNGTGAVMGSKRLKAIVARRPSGALAVHDREALAGVARNLFGRIADSPTASSGPYRWGTLRGVARLHKTCSWLPVKNYTTNVWDISPDLLEAWDGPYIQEHYAPQRNNCWACRFQHCTIMTVPDGPYKGFVGEEPEYEQFAAFGPLVDNKDPTAAFVLANECDRLGFENNEMGWVLGFVMECCERGILSKEQLDGLDMHWGNVEAVRALMRKIAHRDGIGDLLADGVMRAAQAVGGQAVGLAVHTLKGNTPRGHDHRLKWQEMFDTGVSSTGTMEVGPMFNARLDTLQEIGADGLPDEYSPEEIAKFNAKTNGAMLFEDSLGVCRFNTRTDVPLLVGAVNAATGWHMTVDEAMNAGRRAANLFRCFNVRHGIDPELDRPSARYGSAPADPEAVGVSLAAHQGWEQMLSVYYRNMGWDERGIPTRDTLEGLGLGMAADDLGL